jgi:hypothetical protein
MDPQGPTKSPSALSSMTVERHQFYRRPLSRLRGVRPTPLGTGVGSRFRGSECLRYFPVISDACYEYRDGNPFDVVIVDVARSVRHEVCIFLAFYNSFSHMAECRTAAGFSRSL